MEKSEEVNKIKNRASLRTLFASLPLHVIFKRSRTKKNAALNPVIPHVALLTPGLFLTVMMNALNVLPKLFEFWSPQTTRAALGGVMSRMQLASHSLATPDIVYLSINLFPGPPWEWRAGEG